MGAGGGAALHLVENFGTAQIRFVQVPVYAGAAFPVGGSKDDAAGVAVQLYGYIDLRTLFGVKEGKGKAPPGILR
jgi:hypothetical protein